MADLEALADNEAAIAYIKRACGSCSRGKG